MNEKRVFHWVRTTERILQEYRYNEPFARFLTRFHKENKQMGSSDRRMTSRFCYNLFRLGRSFGDFPVLERLILAEFLCESDSPIVAIHKPEWTAEITRPLVEKIATVENQHGVFVDTVFPFTAGLSNEISKDDFSTSFFVQPDLFIRVKRSSVAKVTATLAKQGINFRQVSNRCFALPNGTKLQELKGLHTDFEVQDLSSQRTEDFISLVPNASWWDACAASGGKSLMLLDQCPTIDLLVSDIRLSILRNLDERFDQANITTAYRKKILDLTQSVDGMMKNQQFDGILLDVPCSGSGTWSRTPEMLLQFEEKSVVNFSHLQKKISTNAIPYLKKGGTLVYITCSVFRQENEDVVHYIEQELGLTKTQQQYLLGYGEKADSMFAATFVKP